MMKSYNVLSNDNRKQYKEEVQNTLEETKINSTKGFKIVKYTTRTKISENMNIVNILILLCTAMVIIPSCVGQSTGQYFLEEPQDTTSNLGDDVILKCRVANQEGVMQWTRNQFGLGMDPSLPGYPRYSLTSEGFLKITAVDEEDAGNFQCQVGSGENSLPIMSRQAKLTVQLPPGQPTILGADQANKISVNEGSTGFLECVVDGAKPAAEIEWLDDKGELLRLDSKNSRTKKDDETKTFKTVSSIHFPVDRSMQNKTIVCTAENIASKQPSATSVQLNVLYKPKVSLGINTGAGVVTEGDTVVISCNTDSNPPPYGISWRKNGVIMPGQSKSHLSLEKIDSSFNNAVMECEARNSLGSATASTTLKLLYAPQMIINPKSVAKKEGDKVELKCLATSNPPPRYVWYNIDNPDDPINYSNTYEIIISKHTVGQYKCQAIVDGFPSVDSKIATVSRLEAPKIVKTEDVQTGKVGEDVEIVCSVDTMVLQNLNITWYLRGRVLLEGGKYLMGRSERPGGLEAILRIRDANTLDFGEYACRADNEIGDDYATIMLEQSSSDLLATVLAYLPHIGSAVGGIFLVLIIMSIVYCCRSKKKNFRSSNPSEMEEGFLNNDKPIIKNRSETFRGSMLVPDVMDRLDTASINSRADSLAHLVARPLQNLPPNVAGYYGNAMLNSRIEDDRMSSSSSQSQYPSGGENWGRPPMMGSGRRRSHSPYTTGSEMMEFSANSTLSSVMSKGSRSSRSQPESAAQSSGEETPLMSRRSLCAEINRHNHLNSGLVGGVGSSRFSGSASHSDGEEVSRSSRRFAGNNTGNYSDGEDIGRNRRVGGGGGGNLSDSDQETGGGRGRGSSSGYYSDGGRSGRSLARMRRVSEENHDDKDDELETLSE